MQITNKISEQTPSVKWNIFDGQMLGLMKNGNAVVLNFSKESVSFQCVWPDGGSTNFADMGESSIIERIQSYNN